MHKIWTFSTLQRPTQEEKERRRRYREEQLLRERQHAALVNDKKVNRAKTFLLSAPQPTATPVAAPLRQEFQSLRQEPAPLRQEF